MDRPYEYEIDTLLDVIYFTGSEIEKTSAYGQKTLFVVGLQPIDEVVDVAIRQEVKHIYIGANQSFDYSCIDRHLEAWSALVCGLIEKGYLVTWDFDSTLLQYVTLSLGKYIDHNLLILMISVKIPNIGKLNYNTVVKIDDTSFNVTNPGVWCHYVQDLQKREKYTPWSSYTKDSLIGWIAKDGQRRIL